MYGSKPLIYRLYKKKFDNNFWAVAEEYLNNNTDFIEKITYNLHRVGDFEILDVAVEHLWVEDQPGMEIHFDVALSVTFEVHESDYHYYDSEEKTI